MVSLCPVPSIDVTDGDKHADCLTPSKGGGVSACSGRGDDAQGSAKHRGTRAFSFVSFSFHVKENEETISETTPYIGKTALGHPPKVGSISIRKAIFEETPKEALTFDCWLVYLFPNIHCNIPLPTLYRPFDL